MRDYSAESEAVQCTSFFGTCLMKSALNSMVAIVSEKRQFLPEPADVLTVALNH